MEDRQDAELHLESTERLWTAPVLDACLALLPTPEGATVLSAESRCGLVPMRWAERLPDNTRLIALDPSRSMLDHARDRVDAASRRRVFFISQRVTSLNYADGVFKAAVCLHGVITANQARDGLRELARVIDQGGEVVLVVPLREALPELYDLFDEAFRVQRLDDQLPRFMSMRQSFIDATALEQHAHELGLRDVTLSQLSWQVGFEDGTTLLRSALIRETFFPHWIGAIRANEREPVLRSLVESIDTYFLDTTFSTTMHALCLRARR